jgi:hypothetical protein
MISLSIPSQKYDSDLLDEFSIVYANTLPSSFMCAAERNAIMSFLHARSERCCWYTECLGNLNTNDRIPPTSSFASVEVPSLSTQEHVQFPGLHSCPHPPFRSPRGTQGHFHLGQTRAVLCRFPADTCKTLGPFWQVQKAQLDEQHPHLRFFLNRHQTIKEHQRPTHHRGHLLKARRHHPEAHVLRPLLRRK